MMTAVEWLVEQMINKLGIRIKNTTDGCELFDQAKEMEKQQTIDFGQEILDDIAYDSQGKDYIVNKYNETFKSE